MFRRNKTPTDPNAYPYTPEKWENKLNLKTRRATANIAFQGSLAEGQRTPEGIYVDPNFDLQGTLDNLPGSILELGGPTFSGYPLLATAKLPSKPIITNISAKPHEISRGSRSLSTPGAFAVDALMDAKRLPIRDGSVGMMMFSALGSPRDNFRAKTYAIDTAAQILADGGLLMMRKVNEEDIQQARETGLRIVMHTPLHYSESMGPDSTQVLAVNDVIMQKVPQS